MTGMLAQSFDAEETPQRHAGSTRPPATGTPTIDDAGTQTNPEPFEGSRQSTPRRSLPWE